nr:MAG TPA: hypothetical protein [Caudoviricetes sp.]
MHIVPYIPITTITELYYHCCVILIIIPSFTITTIYIILTQYQPYYPCTTIITMYIYYYHVLQYNHLLAILRTSLFSLSSFSCIQLIFDKYILFVLTITN